MQRNSVWRIEIVGLDKSGRGRNRPRGPRAPRRGRTTCVHSCPSPRHGSPRRGDRRPERRPGAEGWALVPPALPPPRPVPSQRRRPAVRAAPAALRPPRCSETEMINRVICEALTHVREARCDPSVSATRRHTDHYPGRNNRSPRMGCSLYSCATGPF